MTTKEDFERFLKERKTASDAFVEGRIDPLGRISTTRDPATIFGPRGDCVEGAARVNAVNTEGAGMFEPGGTNAFEILHAEAGDELAYWVGVQRSTVRMRGKSEPVPMNLRVTEIFRREGGEWKLVHRHADPLKS